MRQPRPGMLRFGLCALLLALPCAQSALTGYWPLDSDWSDQSPGAQDLVPKSPNTDPDPTFVPNDSPLDLGGGSAQFGASDTSENHYAMLQSFSPRFERDFTIEMWFKLDHDPLNDDGMAALLSFKDLDNNYNGLILGVKRSSDVNRMFLYLDQAPEYRLNADPAIAATVTAPKQVGGVLATGQSAFDPSLETWYHFALTKELDQATWYIDGQKNGDLTLETYNSNSNGIVPGAGCLVIGQEQDGPESGARTCGAFEWDAKERLRGHITELRFWDRARTDKEIAFFWNKRLGVGAGECTTGPTGECCPVGTYEDGGRCTLCEADEGFYCDGAALPNLACPAGFYCAGGGMQPRKCTSAEGFYCPPVFTPIADAAAAAAQATAAATAQADAAQADAAAAAAAAAAAKTATDDAIAAAAADAAAAAADAAAPAAASAQAAFDAAEAAARATRAAEAAAMAAAQAPVSAQADDVAAVLDAAAQAARAAAQAVRAAAQAAATAAQAASTAADAVVTAATQAVTQASTDNDAAAAAQAAFDAADAAARAARATQAVALAAARAYATDTAVAEITTDAANAADAAADAADAADAAAEAAEAAAAAADATADTTTAILAANRAITAAEAAAEAADDPALYVAAAASRATASDAAGRAEQAAAEAEAAQAAAEAAAEAAAYALRQANEVDATLAAVDAAAVDATLAADDAVEAKTNALQAAADALQAAADASDQASETSTGSSIQAANDAKDRAIAAANAASTFAGNAAQSAADAIQAAEDKAGGGGGGGGGGTPIGSGNLNRRSGISGTKGRRCPPNKYCKGGTAQPVDLPPVCDLVQACGPILEQDATCSAKQSTYYSLNNPPAHYATDQNTQTCMKTADAKNDDNAQWVRIDLGSPRVVGTVRFVSDADGNSTDFTVIANMRDASEPQDLPDPSAGGIIPTPYDSCAVSGPVEGVYEAECPPGTIAEFIFVLRASAKEVLEVCDVEVFGHKCAEPATEAPACPEGTEPSACTGADAYCRGCSFCPPGTYSDKTSTAKCTPCPGVAAYGEVPYSPEGATSVFQCEGAQHLDSTSTLAVTHVKFEQSKDAWVIDVDFELGQKIQVNGVAAFYMSAGGDGDAAADDTFQASNFPCQAAGASGNAETACCLQGFREGYVTTELFRTFTDNLDLVAANDVCDGPAGSNMLVNADLDVVGENGTVFVNAKGEPFANPITVELTSTSMADSYYQGVYSARITIPDAELFKVSKRKGQEGSLEDSRELFIGLLDMLPTGTSVVDSSSQQISVVLTRTPYGSFAAYGAQNIDYDFLSYLNARVYQVKNKDALNEKQLEYLDWQWHDTVQAERCSFDPIKGVPVADQCERINTRGDSWDNVCYCVGGAGACGNTGCGSAPLRYPGWEGNYEGATGAAGRELFLESKTAAYFAEISFVWDANLEPAVEGAPVDVNSVTVNGEDDSIWATYSNQWSGTSPLQPCTIGVQGGWAAVAAAAGVPALDLQGFLTALQNFEFFPFDALNLPVLSSEFRELVHGAVFDYNAFFLPLVNQQCGPSVFPADVMGEFDFECLIAQGTQDFPRSAANQADECFVPTPIGYDRLISNNPLEVKLNPAPGSGGDSIYTSAPVMEGFCPQQVRAQDNFALLHVPLQYAPQIYGDEIEVSFDLNLKDSQGETASLKVDMVLKADDFVTMCDGTEGSVDLAQRVVPALQIGSEATAPPRLDRIPASATPTDFATGAETLQDGLITLELALDAADGPIDNLEVFLEDVLVIQVNPGSPVSASDLRTQAMYQPTYTYTPSSRDAQLNIPGDLEDECSEGDAPSPSFFGCVYKHVLADKEVKNDEWAYLVGSGDAQAFMETMLGAGTARASARALGRAYENALLAEGFGTRSKVGLWINPGHVWGQTVQNSEYSLSENVIIYALYGVNAGVNGTTRRMLLQASGDGGRQNLVQTVSYDVKAADLMEKLLPNTVARSWTVMMELDSREACLEPATLRGIMGQRLQEVVAPFASKVRDVQVLSLRVMNAQCGGGERRSASSTPYAVMDAVVALEDESGAFIDVQGLVASGSGILAMQEIDSHTPWAPTDTATPGPEATESGGGANLALMIGAAVGGAVVVLAGCAAYKARRVVCCQGEPLTEVVSASVPTDTPTDKSNIENILMFHKEAAQTRPATQRAPTTQQEVTMEDLFVRASTARRVSGTV